MTNSHQVAHKDYPAKATANAKRGLALNKEVNGKCATGVGRETARILSNRLAISDDRLKRMHSYLQRAAVYYKPNDTKACGTISYLMWGGVPARAWAAKKVEQLDERMERAAGKMSEGADTGLKNKVKEHNESVTAAHKKTSLPTLRKVYRRGVGAYKTNPSSVRPSVKSPEQWAMARVNSYLYALKNERFRGGAHDTDLFPKGHKLRTKGADKDKK